jgi:plasmid stabilization system protein ParE
VKPYRFHRQAEAEFAEAAQHYAEKSTALGVRFYITIMELIHEVREDPQRYRVILSPCRRHFRLPFPYAVIYIERPDDIFIVSVSPFKREHGHWSDRLK